MSTLHSLLVSKLHPEAALPTVSHPGEDLGYDVYALEDVTAKHGITTAIRTGIAVSARSAIFGDMGLLIRDRSSMARRGLFVTGGVVDAGYRGEIIVLMTYLHPLFASGSLIIRQGQKVAQMVPIPVLTGPVAEVSKFDVETSRGDKGFGSSGE